MINYVNKNYFHQTANYINIHNIIMSSKSISNWNSRIGKICNLHRIQIIKMR